MAEVPEHLLQRSAQRRAALTGGGGDAEASATPAVASGSSAAAPAAAAAPAKVVPTEPAFIEPVNKEAFQRVAAIRKRRIPTWAMGVLAVVPVWGALYIGAFGERPTHHEEAVSGATIYGNNCASCHGANGQGGVGPRLSGGETALTFSDAAGGIDAQMDWIRTGSAPFRGQPYGDPARVGGQRVATSGGMPGFQGKLTDEEIQAVAEYERDGL